MVAITRENGKSVNLEDFRQAEDESGTLPIPGQMYPIAITVEILINSVWTDISIYVYQRDDIIVFGGESGGNTSAKSTQCTMTINNRDGRFSPNYIGGLYYPYLQHNTPIRVWVTAVSVTGVYYSGIRFVGFVAKWPPLADTSQTDVYVSITANGPSRQSNQAGGKGSALARYYSLLQPPYNPIAYWPCEENFGTNQIGPGIDGGQAMAVTSGTPTWQSASNFNGSAPLGQMNNSTWLGQTGSTAQGSGDDIFITPGSFFWQAPPGITSVTGQAVGGGGGGFGNDGGGGGGGEYASAAISVTPGNSYRVNVGSPGSKGNNGTNSTFFGDSNGITGHGGSGASGNTGGAGGTGSTASTHFNGGAGAGQSPAGTQVVVELTSVGFGQWTAPPGVTHVKCECYGDGGGASNGAVVSPFATGGGGGGGGEYAAEPNLAVTPGKAYSFLVGTGGAGGGFSSAFKQFGGSDGISTRFQGDSVLIIANGGKGCSYHNGGLTGGGGGSGSTNTVHHNGGSGDIPAAFSGDGGGGGGGAAGSSTAGSAGAAPSGGTGGAGGAGGTGTGLGDPGGTGGAGGNSAGGGQKGSDPGGGGGGGGQSSQGAHQGGAGGKGRIVLTYTPNVVSGGGGGGSGGSASAGNSATTAAGAQAVTYGGPGGNGGAQVAGSSPVSGPGGGGGGSGGGAGGANGFSGQVEITYTPVNVPNWAVIRNVIYVPVSGGNDGKVLYQANMSGALAYVQVKYLLQGGGSFQLVGFNSGNTVLFTSPILAAAANGQTLMLSVELTNSGSSLKYALKVIVPGASKILSSVTGTLASTQVGNVTSVTVGPNQNITKTAMGHFSVQYAYVDLTLVSDALNGHSGEMSIERFLRLANEQALDNAPQFNENTDHWGFEADLQGWRASNGSLSRTSSWASEGQFSAVLTATGEGNPTAFSPQGLLGNPCNPGDVVSANADVSTPGGLSNAYIGIRFWQGSGLPSAVTPEVDGTAGVVLSDATQFIDPTTNIPVKPPIKVSAIVPSDASLYSIVLGDASADPIGTILRFDNVRVQPRMGAQTRKEYQHLLKEIKDLDRAIIRETHWDYNPYTGLPVAGPGMYMRTRWTLFQQSPVVTLDYSKGQCYGTLAPVIDDKLFSNDITVHRYKGSKVVVSLNDGSTNSVTGIRKRWKKYLKVIAERDEQLIKLANLLLNLGANNYERYPTIEFNFARAEVANLFGLAAAVEIGDFIQIINLAFWYPSTTVKQMVKGYEEHINTFNWDVVWSCDPESPFELSVQGVGWY